MYYDQDIEFSMVLDTADIDHNTSITIRNTPSVPDYDPNKYQCPSCKLNDIRFEQRGSRAWADCCNCKRLGFIVKRSDLSEDDLSEDALLDLAYRCFVIGIGMGHD